MQFLTRLTQGERKNVVGIVIPSEIVAALGAGKRPPVKVTLKGYSYRTTVAVMGGEFMVGVAAEHREKAGVAGGDTVEVHIELDTEPRAFEVPVDLRAALDDHYAAGAFEALAPSQRKEHVRNINEAKSEDTRKRRIAGIVQKVLARS